MAKFCTNCGKEIPEGVAFCTECGTKAPETQAKATVSEQPVKVEEQKVPEMVPPVAVRTQQASPQQHPYGQPHQPITQPRELTDSDVKGTKYEPISAWGFIGIMLLMCIPIVGLILTIVWACGGCRKLCKRSLARATIIMAVIGIIIGIIFALVGGALINSLFDKAGLETSENGGIFSGLFNADNSEDNEEENIGGLTSLFGGGNDDEGGLFGGTDSESSGNSDYEGPGELGELFGVLEALGGLTGGEENLSGLEGLFGEIEDINAEAEKQNNGWPASLRKYPGGTPKEVASYRTIIENTSAEEMNQWINSLKSDGYVYTDFYDIGMSEADMLSSNGWWGTNGEYYISVSYSNGATIVDHLTELPESLAYIN